ncbi:hypothetical protein PybrP1_013166 [[Pythium] brassicae (nom. inval.)]|nr:hypothetical protein PybrP1_013166 [[Pythium] brassicae (nom. inval.)]
MHEPLQAHVVAPGVFFADDKFPDVIRCLEARGWRRHLHASFPGCRLKWTNYQRIAWAAGSTQRQTLNHLQHAVAFSQKELFARALYELDSRADGPQRVHAFYPRTFDLRRDADAALLREWALYCHALAALKHFVARGAALSVDKSDAAGAVVDAAIALLADVAAAGTAFFSRTTAAGAAPVVIDVAAPQWRALRPGHHGCGGDKSDCRDDDTQSREERKERAEQLLQQLAALDPQFDTVGADNNRSVWICKPSNLSQGRGIRLLTSLDEVLALCTTRGGGGDSDRADAAGASQPVRGTSDASTTAAKWVVQKYVEQPLLSLQGGCKFDIRQWVLVASLAPLRVFWYTQSYLRFCSQPFSLERTQLADPFVHLSNFSVQKDAPELPSSRGAGDENDENARMWRSDRFQERLRQEHGRDVWAETIVPQMQLATRAAILSTAPKLRAVGHGFEWLGLDFLLDASFRPWLLEVNVSPDVSHSTSVTAELVPCATEDLLELILDGTASPDNGWLPLACSPSNASS